MNPDDLLELLKAATIGLRGDPNRPNPRGLPQAELAKIRQGIKKARADGVSDDELNSYLTQNYGRSLADLTTPTRRDVLRAAVPFGGADELAGIVKMLPLRGQLGSTPDSYSEARDATRENMAGARAVAPKSMLAAEVAGSLPLAAVGGPAVQGLSGGARAVAAAETGGLLGGLSALGHSERETVGGTVDDVGAGIVGGTALGLLGSAGGQLVGKVARPIIDRFRPEKMVMQEVAPLIEGGQAGYLARAAQQEAAAPGTVAMIDEVPKFGKIVSQSRDVAAKQIPQLKQRISELDKARSAVGKRYNPLDEAHARMPVDDELRAVVGDRLKLGETVSLKELRDLRSAINKRLTVANEAYETGVGADRLAAGPVIAELAPIKTGLNNWMRPKVAGLEDVDKAYGGISSMLAKSHLSLKHAAPAQENAAVARAGGNVAASAGSALTERPSFGALLREMLGPSREKRAEVVGRLLMEPGGNRRAVSLLAQEPNPINELLSRSLLFGSAAQVPSLIGQ